MQEYINVDQRLHLLCQILAKVTANLIPEESDYSHTNLSFDPIGNRIITRWIKIENSKICLALNLNKYSFQWINDGFQVIKNIFISGKTLTQLENEIQSSLSIVGINSKELLINLKYEIEKYSFIDMPFEVLNKESLDLWIYYRSLANAACDELLRYINAKEEVRIWPHHFDTGIYKDITSNLGVGFGLAMKDNLVDSPYFYLSGYAQKGKPAMKNLPKLEYGFWETGDWKGAVLSLSQLNKLDRPKRKVVLKEFIKRTLSWYSDTSIKTNF